MEKSKPISQPQPQMQQVEVKTTEELALLLAQAYEQMFANQANIRILLQEISTRQQRHNIVEKEINNDE